jgi:hypothetical protein
MAGPAPHGGSAPSVEERQAVRLLWNFQVVMHARSGGHSRAPAQAYAIDVEPVGLTAWESVWSFDC